MHDPDATPLPVEVPVQGTAANRAARAFVKSTGRSLAPHLVPVAKQLGPAMAMLLLSAAQHWSGKAETEHKVKVGYETVASASIDHTKEIAELKAAVAQLADSVALQTRLALASRPGFDDKGKPEAPAVVAAHHRHPRPVAPPVDPTLVKKVQDDAAKNQALKARLVVERPAQLAVPPTLPSEVPTPQPAPRAVAPAQEWPPPIPVAPAPAEKPPVN